MTGDRHDELSALDLSMIAVVLTPSWWVWILTVMPVWLYFSSLLFCSVSFLNTKLCILRRDQLVISTHDIDTLSNWKVTRTQGYLIKYQILQYDDKCVAENNEKGRNMFMIQRKSLFKTISTAKHLFSVSHRIHAEIQDLKRWTMHLSKRLLSLYMYKELYPILQNFISVSSKFVKFTAFHLM